MAKRRSNAVKNGEADKPSQVNAMEPTAAQSSQGPTYSHSQNISGPAHSAHQPPPRFVSSLEGDTIYQNHQRNWSRNHSHQKQVPKKRSSTTTTNNINLNSSSNSNNITMIELEGHQKFIWKKGYFENLRCPSCIMNNAAQIRKYHGIPWVNWSKSYRNCDLYEGLTAELEDFYRFVRPTEEDEMLRKATFYSIAKSIKRCKKFDIDAVKYYGSYSSSTYLPVSDIDIVVFANPEFSVVAILFELARLLFQDGIIEKHCSVIPHSRIPLLKFYDCLTGFQINITVNTPNVMERANYIRENFRPDSYELKILYFMKYYLIYKGSNQVYLGGIGSYALSLMVIRFFQERETKDLIRQYEQQEPPTLLARLLIGFLQRYSDVDFIRSCRISVRGEGEYIVEPAVQASFCPSFYKKTSILRIEDHMEPWKNVSAGSFNSDLILQDFGVLLKVLLNPDQNERSKIRVSIIGNALTVVDSFVEYRTILATIFDIWFQPNTKRAHSNAGSYITSEKYEMFLAHRNVFGHRNIEFDYKQFEDNTAQLVLKDKLVPGMRCSVPQRAGNYDYGRYYLNTDQTSDGGCGAGNDAYSGPVYTSSVYHFPDHGDVPPMHSTAVRHNYSDKASKAKSRPRADEQKKAPKTTEAQS